jgi:ornithine cyclodeaminase
MSESATESGPVLLTEREAAKLLPLSDAIEVLREVYGATHACNINMPRAHARHGDRILHAVGGILPDRGIAGTKTWLYTPAGAQPLLILFSPDDGRVAAVIEAFGLGQRRTAATSGLGTALLARADADVLALLGTGKQALAQAHAVAAVRQLRRVQVFGRDPNRREQLCARLDLDLGVEAEGFGDVGAALEGAQIVTAITRAADPIVFAEMLTAGMHINAVGAIVPARSELDARVIGRCDVIVADSCDQAREDSQELQSAVGAGLLRFEDVVDLAELVADPERGRTTDDQITLFKAQGVGLSDVALGAEILTRAIRAGAGTPLHPRGEANQTNFRTEPGRNTHV